MNILILKDNYNSFERYYLDRLKSLYPSSYFYYTSNSKLRKLWTHIGMPFENIWYGEWKNKIQEFELIIVFDSIHSSKMLEYIHKHTKARLIFWHWNPIKTNEEIKIISNTQNICEHWTFNQYDAEKYKMHLNNQFFFYQQERSFRLKEEAFFVGTDKGRYDQLMELSKYLIDNGINPDFHIVDAHKEGKFYQKDYMQYDAVLRHLRKSRYLVEIVQEDQNGLTARTLEAMFFGKKLITNNAQVKKCSFFDRDNIYVMNDGLDINAFFEKPFRDIERSKLFRYSAEGWIKNFIDINRGVLNKEVGLK